MSAMILGAMTVMRVLLANIESRQTLSVRWFTTLSQQMLTAIKYVTYEFFWFSAGHHTGTSCMQHSQTAGARTLNFTSFNNGLQLKKLSSESC